jgi:hypothetical protein
MSPKLPSPKRRGYGRGSVSIQDGRYVATYQSLETGRPIRKSFASDVEAQTYLDRWYADKQERKLTGVRGDARLPRAPARAVEAPVGTFAELLIGWRAFKTGSVRATTWRSYGPALSALTYYLSVRRGARRRAWGGARARGRVRPG